MGDSLMSVIAIIIAVIIMVGLPLIAMANQTDKTTNMAVQTATTDFVNNIRKKGVIDIEDYNGYVSTLASTGNSYQTSIVLQIVNGNLAKKDATGAESIGDNVYYTKYTTQIIEELNRQQRIPLNEGDIITVTAENTNLTIAQQLRNFFYKVTGNNSSTVTAEASGMVTTTGY